MVKYAMLYEHKKLPEDPVSLKEIVLQQQMEIDFLREQFRLAQARKFAASSEVSPHQIGFFNEAENDSEDGVIQVKDSDPSQASREISYTRKPPGRKPLPKDLPRDIVIHDISDEEKICACCQGQLHKMGEERSEQLEFIPPRIKVIENIRPKYSCRACEKNATQVAIVIAPVPDNPIPKSITTASLLSQIIVQKYQFSLPLYRQEIFFKQYGIELSRKTMANWMIKCATILTPVIDRLKSELLAQSIIQADETTVKVIHDDTQKSYMWLYCTGADSPTPKPGKNIVLYDYHPSRSAHCPVDYLQGFKGYLVVDGYSAYEHTDAQLAGCMAHARRKFIEAQRGQVKRKTGKADWAVNHIKKLYRVETQAKACTPQERFAFRQQEAKPLLDEFKQWLDKSIEQVPPKSLIGKAISYSLKQWHKLERYLEDGQLPIDNNRAERAIKPFVIGRKNWMFSNTAKGAQASASLYSIIETAKANGLDPYRYINTLLEELPKREQGSDIRDLLPWSIEC